jgi:hypothetical protein
LLAQNSEKRSEWSVAALLAWALALLAWALALLAWALADLKPLRTVFHHLSFHLRLAFYLLLKRPFYLPLSPLNKPPKSLFT